LEATYNSTEVFFGFHCSEGRWCLINQDSQQKMREAGLLSRPQFGTAYGNYSCATLSHFINVAVFSAVTRQHFITLSLSCRHARDSENPSSKSSPSQEILSQAARR